MSKFLTLMFILLTATPNARAQTITGTSAAMSLIPRVWAAYFLAHENLRDMDLNSVQYIGGGSAKGEADIVSGKIDLTLMNRPIRPEALQTAAMNGIAIKGEAIGLRPVSIIVNKENNLFSFLHKSSN